MMKRTACVVLGVLVMAHASCSLDTRVGQAAAQGSAADAERWATETLSRLTLPQKAAQMVCEQIRGEYIAANDERFEHWVALARDYGIGGFVVYGGTPHDTADLLNRLQKAAAVPLLVSADFEGGPGQQFAGASEFPANMALAAIGSEALAYEVGKAGALEGRAIGVHLTYSPVVDVQTIPANPVLSVRSFGSDVDLLGRLAGAYIRGYQENGMIATAKHFPGRGDVELIPGTEFAINRKPAARVEREDFAAFKKVIDAGVAFVMTEHIAVPSVTNGSDLPASVERALATDWLKGKLGFSGVLTSDDLWYAKVTDRFGPEKAGIMAIQAGHDVLLKPASAIKMIQAIVDAVKSGAIPEKQIDGSVRKLLVWKARLNLHRNRFVDMATIDDIVGVRAHKELIRRIADESLTVLQNDGFLPATAAKVGKALHVSIQRNEADVAPVAVAAKLQEAFSGVTSFTLRPSVDPALYARVRDAASRADTVIVSLFNQRTTYKDNGPLSDGARSLLADLSRARPHATVVMSYGNPYLVESVPASATFVVGYGEGGFYGNQLVFADSFVRLLKGEIAPKGKLAIRISESFPFGSGIRY